MEILKHTLTAILVCATFPTLAGLSKLDLVLLNPIPSDAPDGRLVMLKGPGSDGCRYVGTLESASHQVAGLADKLMTAGIGNADRFVKVTRKDCGERVEPTTFLIPLGRMKPGPGVGTRLTVLVAE